jgi:transposase
LTGSGVEVVEVNRPNRRARRRRGKSEPADAEAAARAALNGEASARYKGDGRIAGLRWLRVARRDAVKARTQAANQINDMLLSAPQALRDRLRPLSTKQVVDVAIRFRPRATTDSAELTKSALRSLARRYQTLSEEIDQLDVQLAELVTDITPPEMLERMGVGANVAASLLIAAGDKPKRLSK